MPPLPIPSRATPPRWGRRIALALGLLAAVTLLPAGCSSTTPRRDPTGELFPRVTGTALSGESVTLPDRFSGKPVVLLVGYLQESQFDIDRWLLGLTTLETPITLAEVPTIPGMVPSLFSGLIDDGMRSGIPKADWAGVITLYGGEAGKIASATGNDVGLPARVLLLDANGKVVWFHDEGFSPRVVRELDQKARALSS